MKGTKSCLDKVTYLTFFKSPSPALTLYCGSIINNISFDLIDHNIHYIPRLKRKVRDSDLNHFHVVTAIIDPFLF